jgi:Skp family chaperone for outer membrane proteins
VSSRYLLENGNVFLLEDGSGYYEVQTGDGAGSSAAAATPTGVGLPLQTLSGDGSISIAVNARLLKRYTRLTAYATTGRFPSNADTVFGGAGTVTATFSTAGIGAFLGTPAVTTVDQPTAGYDRRYRKFDSAYRREQRRRRRLKELQDELEAETEALPKGIDREIALLLRQQEAKDLKRQELARLKRLADNSAAQEAIRSHGERVAKALERAVTVGNYSALAALDREIARARDEEESVMFAVTLLISED